MSQSNTSRQHDSLVAGSECKTPFFSVGQLVVVQKVVHTSTGFTSGMATALHPVTLKRGNEQLLKFRAGTKVDTIVHGLATVCPGGRIEDSEGFVVTLGYGENLTESEYTVIDPTPAGAVANAPVDARGVIQSLLIPLDSWPSPEDFLQYLVRQDGRKIPVSQRAFEKARCDSGACCPPNF
ncbi:hypothetical protein WJX82_011313 [Trebouxia sp. C0006]